MSQLETLKATLLNARKAKDEVAKNILSYLLGQAQLKGKEPTDEQIFDIYKAYLKQMKDVKNEVVEREVAIINDLLPKQLTVEQIEQTISEMFLTNEKAKTDFGVVMSHFKSLYSGMFNPGDIRSAWMKLKG